MAEHVSSNLCHSSPTNVKELKFRDCTILETIELETNIYFYNPESPHSKQKKNRSKGINKVLFNSH